MNRHKGEGKRGFSMWECHEQLDSLEYPDKRPNNMAIHSELFNVALNSLITLGETNILFLKLLEAQLISYHKGETKVILLNSDLIKD
jgi:hypothetical protein